MLVEVSGECSGMTGLYSQEYWKELDQCNSLLLPTLDHESNNIEMEELEEIASNFPCFNPSNLQPALIPVTLQQLTSTRIQPRSPTKLEIGPSSLEILSPRSPSHNIHSLPTIISPRLPPSRPHSTVISPHLHPQPLHPHPHSHLHPHPHPSLHLSHQSQSINSSHINSSNLLSIISSSHHLPSTPSPHHLPSAPSPHHHPTAPSPHHIPPAPSPNPLSPIQRTRCNTWPRMLQSQDMNESFYDADPSTPVTFPSQPGGPYCCIPGSNPSRAGPPALLPLSSHPSPPTLLPLLSEEIQEDPDEDESMNEQKQKISRRNPWGNFSYADLITQAIQNSPGQRLTLAQIYDWLIVNIPYFKERADVNSSAGWKNSIRHNLSLHTKFVKVQNEGTGKSSWWTIAPEIKQAPKPPRRRAASMESSKLKKEKERAMHKVRARLERASSTNSTGSCSGLSSCSLFSNEPSSPSSFSFRGIECRPRTSSSTSSDSSYTHRTDSDVSVSSCLDLADLQRCCISQNPGSDLDNIHLDNLNIQPGNIIREYLHPGSTSKQTPEQMEYRQNSKLIRRPVSLNTSSSSFNINSSLSLMNSAHGLNNSYGVCRSSMKSSGSGDKIIQKPTGHKLTILEPRDNTFGIEHPVIQYSRTVGGGIQQYKPTVHDPQDWVIQYTRQVAGLFGCTDERLEREKELKRHEMILSKIEELKNGISKQSSESERRKTELLLTLLQEMVEKKPEIKVEFDSSQQDISQKQHLLDVDQDQDHLSQDQDHLPHDHDQDPWKSTASFSLYQQIMENNQNKGSVYENEGRECIDETTMGELDESSLQQIENILSLDNDMETTQAETEDLCFPSSSSKTISKNEETSCEENLSRALSDWEATVGDTQSRIGLKINNDGLSSMNEGYLDFRAKGIKRPSRGTIISQYLSTPS